MTETTILDESAVSEIEALNWKKGFPDLDGDYYCRVDEYDKQPTLIRIESRSSSASAAVYEFGCGDDLRREYEAEEEYEYLGPLNPESIPALCATVKHLRVTEKTLQGQINRLAELAETRSDLIAAKAAHVDQLQSQLEQLHAENVSLKMIVDVGTSDDPGTAIQKVARIEKSAVDNFRSRAIQLCKDKAAEWEQTRYMNDLEKRRFNAYAEAYREMAQLLEQQL